MHIIVTVHFQESPGTKDSLARKIGQNDVYIETGLARRLSNHEAHGFSFFDDIDDTFRTLKRELYWFLSLFYLFFRGATRVRFRCWLAERARRLDGKIFLVSQFDECELTEHVVPRWYRFTKTNIT